MFSYSNVQKVFPAEPHCVLGLHFLSLITLHFFPGVNYCFGFICLVSIPLSQILSQPLSLSLMHLFSKVRHIRKPVIFQIFFFLGNHLPALLDSPTLVCSGCLLGPQIKLYPVFYSFLFVVFIFFFFFWWALLQVFPQEMVQKNQNLIRPCMSEKYLYHPTSH